jgi:hypothetical protein
MNPDQRSIAGFPGRRAQIGAYVVEDQLGEGGMGTVDTREGA